jgi:flagellar motor switch protein FliG
VDQIQDSEQDQLSVVKVVEDLKNQQEEVLRNLPQNQQPKLQKQHQQKLQRCKTKG